MMVASLCRSIYFVLDAFLDCIFNYIQIAQKCNASLVQNVEKLCVRFLDVLYNCEGAYLCITLENRRVRIMLGKL